MKQRSKFAALVPCLLSLSAAHAANTAPQAIPPQSFTVGGAVT